MTTETVAPTDFPYPVLSPRSIWHMAMDEAQKWRSDAFVANVEVSFVVRDGEGGFTLVDFVVISPTDNDESLWIVCEEANCLGSVVERAPYHEILGSAPIKLDDFTLSAKDALEISLNLGGSNFMRGIGDNTVSAFVKLTRLATAYSGRVYWRVSYLDIATRQHLNIDIDANTGEVLEIRD